jgi:hypothetical protein
MSKTNKKTLNSLYSNNNGILRSKSNSLCCIVARIIRGKTKEDFEYLSPLSKKRRTIFMIDTDDIKLMLNKKGYDILLNIGYPEDYIKDLIKQNIKFKLVVISKNDPNISVKIASWDNVIDLMKLKYPKIKLELEKHRTKLKTIFKNKKVIKKMEKISKDSNHEDFMTYEKYLKSNRTLIDTRAFLYHVEGLNSLYSGDGYIYNEKGEKKFKEYIADNVKLSKLKNYKIIPLNVKQSKTLKNNNKWLPPQKNGTGGPSLRNIKNLK